MSGKKFQEAELPAGEVKRTDSERGPPREKIKSKIVHLEGGESGLRLTPRQGFHSRRQLLDRKGFAELIVANRQT